MKKLSLILLFLVSLAWTGCHKDNETNAKDPVISKEEMTISGTQVCFEWHVDFLGQFQTGVELSRNENMSDLRRVEATKHDEKYVAIVDGLSMGTRYYYRIVVWNKFNNYGQQVKDFTTIQECSVILSCNPEEGGTALGDGIFVVGDTCTVVAIANAGYNFVNWTENENQISADVEYKFTVINDRNLVAHFTSQEFTITATAEPEEGGTVSGSGGYNNGDECTLTATPNEGYSFINWTKDETELSNNPVYIFTVTETATYVANFQVQSYIITVSANPAEGGSVEGGGTYEYGQNCTVRATEANGYHFVNWTENGEQVSSDEEYTFTVTSDRDLVAHFTSQNYIIHVDIDPENSGTVTGAQGYNYDEECTLKAIPAEGFSFVKWTEGDNDILDNPYIFRVTESRNFVAHFQAINYQISVSAEPSGGGTVTGGGNGFHYGDECEVTATAIDGYEFVKWTKEDGTEIFTNPYTFNVTESVSLVAHFQLINYTISVSAVPSDGGTVTGGGNGFHYNNECILTATPNVGYEFVKWTKEGGTEISFNPVYTFNVTETAAYIAHFQLINYTISISAEPSGGGIVTGGGNGFHYGDECTVTATANSNYNFINWTENGDQVSTNANYTFTVFGDRNLTANFTDLNIPQNLTAADYTAFDDEIITLIWDPIVDRTFLKYFVYRDGVKVGETQTYNIDNATYTDGPLAYNMNGYVYYVTAVYDEGESTPSNEVTVQVSGYGYINGHVYEQDGMTGIAGATVTMTGLDEFNVSHTYIFTTNSQGYYSGHIYAGSYNGQASKNGYQTVTEPVQGNPIDINYNVTTSPIDYILGR